MVVKRECGGVPRGENAEHCKRCNHPYRQQILGGEKDHLVGSPDPGGRATRSGERERQKSREEAALARPLNDSKGERDSGAAGCDEPGQALPVAPQAKPAQHSQRCPDSRQLAACRNPCQHAGRNHPRNVLAPDGNRRRNQRAHLQQHRQHIPAHRRADEHARVRRRKQTSESKGERRRAPHLPEDDKGQDEQCGEQRDRDGLAGHEVLTSQASRRGVDDDGQRHVSGTAESHSVRQRRVERPFVRILCQRHPDALNVTDLVTVADVDEREKQPPRDSGNANYAQCHR